MSAPMFEVRLTPYWAEPCEFEPTFLVSLPREDQPLLVELWINGRRYVNKHWPYKSPCCGCPLFYIGWQTEQGWFLRWKCPKCGDESMTMHPGWKSPKPETPVGGQEDMVYATRRERSGY